VRCCCSSENIPRSDRERGEGFHHTSSNAVDLTITVAGPVEHVTRALDAKRTPHFLREPHALRDVTETQQSGTEGRTPTSNQFLGICLAVGAILLVGHVRFLSPGWLWFEVAWAVAGLGGVVGAVAGYLGFGATAGIAGSSTPGLALTLRGEYWLFYYGCFDRPSGRSVCTAPPAGAFRRTVLPLALSVGFVLAHTVVGYALGAGMWRARDRI
jgi:hypothetical protein